MTHLSPSLRHDVKAAATKRLRPRRAQVSPREDFSAGMAAMVCLAGLAIAAAIWRQRRS